MGCEAHKWTTRHSEAKYRQFAEEMQRCLGGPEKCWINQVPGAWLSQKHMNALQFNEYPSMEAERVSITGRMGTFEVYGNLGAPQSKTIIVHLFSK